MFTVSFEKTEIFAKSFDSAFGAILWCEQFEEQNDCELTARLGAVPIPSEESEKEELSTFLELERKRKFFNRI